MQATAYIESFAARGVTLWREGESLKFRAPAGVLTPAVLARLKEAKPKILPILPELEEVGKESPSEQWGESGGKVGEFKQVQTLSPLELVEVGKESPSELRQVATKFAPRLEHIETVSRGEFEQVGTVLPSTELYQDKRQEVLSWALFESRRGLLPDLAEALTLPSGQVVPGAGASAWLIAWHDRALRLGLQPYPDCEAALMILRHDLRALSLWAAHAYEHSTPHEGDDTP